jgi:predicted nucleic acid-binding protein
VILLDSDVMIDVLRKHPPAVAWANSLLDEEVVLPGVVVMELVQGCHSSGQLGVLLRTLRPFRQLWPSESDCTDALASLITLRLSDSLSLTDALIAHTALGRDLPLHTFNQNHFAKIPGLRTVQPYKR